MQQTTIEDNKYSIKYFPDEVKKFEKAGNYFYFYTTETILEVRVITDKIVRFRYAPDGKFKRDFSYAISPDLKETLTALELVEEGDSYVIRTSKIDVFVDKKDIRVTVTDKAGHIINQDAAGFHWQYYILKGGKIVYCSKEVQEDECFFGMGDKPTELNLRGKRLENYGRDSYGFQKDEDPLYKNIPFYYGLHHGMAYGLFFDNTFRTLFDFGQEREDVASFWARGGQMNYYFIYGPELLEVARQYVRLTGTPELPPLWALGYQQSRWSYFPDTKVKEVASEFRKRAIPCDAIHLDIDYMEGFRCFTFSKERFPDPKGLTDELAAIGIKTIAIIDPGIKADPDYWVYKEGVEKNYFCRRADGAFMVGDVWPGRCVFPDFSNPEVREWWKGLFKIIADVGISAVWTDMNEPAVFELGTFPEDVRHDYDGDPCSHRKAHNIYGHLMSKATAEGVKKFLMPKRSFVITRSCYSGAQRWTSVWTGDNMATWEHLWLASVMCQRLSVSGISFAGTDIGGFIGEPDGELYVRWIQLAVFHTFMRTHSASNDSGFDQEPWSFGPVYESVARKFINLRYRLLPYHYTTFWQYVSEGTPMLRPLCFVAQDDPETHHRNEEFMFGDHLLISAVVRPGQKEKKVYLPAGRWYNYWTDEKMEGGQEVVVSTPLDEIPLFVRAGAVIPHYPLMQYVGEKPVEEMILHVYSGSDHVTSNLYEDAGDHYGYLQNEYNTIRFKQVTRKKHIRLKKRYVGHFNADYKKYKITVHGLDFKPGEIVINGRSQPVTEPVPDRQFTFEVDRDFEKIILR